MDRREGKPWSEPQEEEINARKFYQVIQGDKDNLESNAKGKLLHGSPSSVDQNSDIELYEWQMDNYESKARECWTVEAIPKESLRSCFSIKVVPTTYEKRIRQYPNLIPSNTKSTTIPPLKFKEWESPALHVNELSKSVDEQGQLQSLVQWFT